jgi:hypothetical protein
VDTKDPRRRSGSGRDSTRTPLIVAILAALLAAAALTAGVAYVIRPPDNGRTAEVPETVAALAPVVMNPSPTMSPTPELASTPTPTPRRMVTPRINPTFTPKPTVKPSPKATRTPKPSPTAEATAAALHLSAGGDLAEWSGPNWGYANGVLINDGEGVVSHRWLEAPFEPPDGGYALEAEIRVIGVSGRHCEQSFGVVAGGERGVVWGGGVIFDCDKVRRARVTDVTDWSNGYNRHRVLDVVEFEPGEEWHLYRLEVDGAHVRLLIDGSPVLEVDDDEASDAGEEGEVGLWSHGVQLEVRWVAVFEM